MASLPGGEPLVPAKTVALLLFLAFVALGLWDGLSRAWADEEDIPLLIGAQAHGAENIEALADLGLGNFVWLPPPYYWETGNTPWDEKHSILDDVDACVRRGKFFMLTQRRGLGDKVRPGGFEYGGHGSGEVHSETTIRQIVRRGGKFFVGLHGEELDADFLQNVARPIFAARIPYLYTFTDRAGGKASFEGELNRLSDRYHGWGARFIPNLCLTYQLSGFRSEADIVIAELLEHLPTTELQLAYLRGGARQFGKPWGVWVSPWWWGTIHCEDPSLWKTKRGKLNGGHSLSELRRALYLSYVSGARILTTQETEPILARNPDGTYRLAAWGRELKKLWDYASQSPQPLEPVTPLALLIDQAEGWAPAHLWQDWILRETIWGKLPTSRGDWMLSKFLNVFLPGFGRTRESVMEKRDVYPGYFAATPFGPFDVVASDISAEALKTYRCVCLLGDVEMTEQLREVLREYVRDGGTLLINVLQMRRREALVQDEEFLGAKLGTRIFASARIDLKEKIPGIEETAFSEPWFCAIDVRPTRAKVLAAAHDGHPVLLSNRYGKGTVYLSTPEYMMEGYAKQDRVLTFFVRFLESLVKRFSIRVENARNVSWVAAKQGRNSLLFAFANHGSKPAEIDVFCENADGPARVELGTDAGTVRSGQDSKNFRLRIKAESVLLLRVPILPKDQN